jgi:hypothetical protein
MRSIVGCAILLAACSSSSRGHDMASARDLAAPSDLSVSGDLSGLVALVEGPCPVSLNNLRCYHVPTDDAGFF